MGKNIGHFEAIVVREMGSATLIVYVFVSTMIEQKRGIEQLPHRHMLVESHLEADHMRA